MLQKSKHLHLFKHKMGFGDLDSDFARRCNDIKLVILANMTLNVILTLIEILKINFLLFFLSKKNFLLFFHTQSVVQRWSHNCAGTI